MKFNSVDLQKHVKSNIILEYFSLSLLQHDKLIE